MLDCAIPGCCAQEKLLRSGTLHLVDTVRDNGTTSKKMIFLCKNCTLKYTVQTWRSPGEQIRLRERASTLTELAAVFAPKPTRLRKLSTAA